MQCGVSIFTNVHGNSAAVSGPIITVYCFVLVISLFALVLENLAHKDITQPLSGVSDGGRGEDSG